MRVVRNHAPRAGSGLGRAWPVIGGLAALCGLSIVLMGLPLLGIAANRLTPARPVFGSDAIGTTLSLVIAASTCGLIAVCLSDRRTPALAAVAALAAAILLLVDGLGAGAAAVLAGAAQAARASLASGSWLALALLAAALGFAIRRSRVAWLGPGIVTALILAVILLGRAGRLDSLSLAVEYAARREAVHAAIREHLVLSGSSLVLASAGAVLLSSWRRGQAIAAILVGGIQVVPAVALLGGLVAATGGLLRALPFLRDLGLSALGVGPAIVGIAAYLLLPLWRGLALALRSPDVAILDAAEAVGLTPRQILIGVRLPLGAPILIGALRVAAVQALGLATLGALVGAGGLGRIVFDGMAQFASDFILLGAIPVVALSLGAEMGLSRIESAARRRWHA